MDQKENIRDITVLRTLYLQAQKKSISQPSARSIQCPRPWVSPRTSSLSFAKTSTKYLLHRHSRYHTPSEGSLRTRLCPGMRPFSFVRKKKKRKEKKKRRRKRNPHKTGQSPCLAGLGLLRQRTTLCTAYTYGGLCERSFACRATLLLLSTRRLTVLFFEINPLTTFSCNCFLHLSIRSPTFCCEYFAIQ